MRRRRRRLSAVCWQLSDYPLLLMRIFLSQVRMRHADTAEQSHHCLFELLSLIRNTLHHVTNNLSVMIACSTRINRSLARSFAVIKTQEQINLRDRLATSITAISLRSVITKSISVTRPLLTLNKILYFLLHNFDHVYQILFYTELMAPDKHNYTSIRIHIRHYYHTHLICWRCCCHKTRQMCHRGQSSMFVSSQW